METKLATPHPQVEADATDDATPIPEQTATLRVLTDLELTYVGGGIGAYAYD